MPASSASHTRLSFRVPEARRDELTAELWSLGTTGIHLRPTADGELVDAYFDEAATIPSGDQQVRWDRYGAELIESIEVKSTDWLAAYRARCEPIAVGPFVIDPREPDGERSHLPAQEDPSDMLRIPARNAFGTGSHESTRLILEVLAALDLRGRSVLDVGTGSGILAFAASRLGACPVVGLDVDVGSVIAARDNSRLNALPLMLFAGRVGSLVEARFDVVLANILPERWLGEVDAVVDRLRDGGDLLVSGLLREQRAIVLERLEPRGLRLRAERTLDEWSALHLRSSCEGRERS